MEFINILDVLRTRELSFPKLGIFNAPFRMLLWQPKGEVLFSREGGFICVDEDHNQKAYSFLLKAKEENAGLVLTPECSLPFSVFNQFFSEKRNWPTEGKLWALCMEGISISNYAKEKEKLSKYIYIDDAYERVGIEKHLNIMLYIYYDRQKDNLIIVSQYKTGYASDKYFQAESTFLSRGDTIYYWGNKEHCTNAICSFICADIMSNQVEKFNQICSNNNMQAIILNPQLNPRPMHNTFVEFRKRFLSHSNQIKMISLNWASPTNIKCDEEMLSIEHGLSSYSKNTLDRNRIDNNQFSINTSHGLFYAIDGNTEIWFLSHFEGCAAIATYVNTENGLNRTVAAHADPICQESFISEEGKWINPLICSLDWEWINKWFIFDEKSCENHYNDTVGMYICSKEGNCGTASIKVTNFFASFFSESHNVFSKLTSEGIGNAAIRVPEKATRDPMFRKMLIRRQQLANIVQCIKQGLLPNAFKEIDGNYVWIFDPVFNIASTTGGVKSKVRILFSELQDEHEFEKIIGIAEKMSNNYSVRNNCIVYYPSHEGYKYYDELYNTDISNPEFANYSSSLI